MKGFWKTLRYRLEWLALTAVLKLVPLLSRKACYRLAGFAGALAATFDRRSRRVALSNLEVAFGDGLSPERRAEIVRESYQHFARTMLDLFWSPRLTRENHRSYIEFEGIEHLERGFAAGRGLMVGAFHYGNFEWLSHACAWAGYAGAIATQEFKNPLLDKFFETLRERSGHETVPREGAIIRLYKILRRRGRIALLVDTTLKASQPTVVIDCFGLKTMVTVAHAWLKARTGAALVPMYCEPLGDGRYRVVAQPAIEVARDASHQEIAQACWDSFEPIVRKNPAPWLWMYKHWRYKPLDARRSYPFYAQESLAYEQVAARQNYAKFDRAAFEAATLAAAGGQ
ncbi:MAG TPA: lysophospholipid acyltransferase family protein [Chthoniobacterales bacterium]